MRRLQRQDKLLFKINYSFDKDQTTIIDLQSNNNLLYDGKNISDPVAYFMRVYMIWLIFPGAPQLALLG